MFLIPLLIALAAGGGVLLYESKKSGGSSSAPTTEQQTAAAAMLAALLLNPAAPTTPSAGAAYQAIVNFQGDMGASKTGWYDAATRALLVNVMNATGGAAQVALVPAAWPSVMVGSTMAISSPASRQASLAQTAAGLAQMAAAGDVLSLNLPKSGS